LTCGEFDKAVESFLAREHLMGVTHAKPRNCRPRKEIQKIRYKGVNGGKLVSNDGGFKAIFRMFFAVPPGGLKPMFHVEHKWASRHSK
jgi:hypothetical protein